MHLSELRLPELLDFSPEQGKITFRDHRMLLWDADAFGALRAELVEHLGAEAARGILMRFGFANGYRDALSTRTLLPWSSESDWWRACPALQGHQGKVLAEVDTLEVDRSAGRFDLVVRWLDAYEATQHRRLLGVSTEPVCWTLIGYASGFSTAVMGEEIFVVEQHCAATGHRNCQVIGKTRRAWGARGSTLAAQYRADTIADRIDARVEEVQRAGRATLRGGQLRARSGHRLPYEAESATMRQLLELVDKVAQSEVTVLITGESGVGKERVATRLHEHSARRTGPFIAINCGALPEALLESELFGHVRGAFSGALTDKSGLFAAAQGGTIFLDEIGEASLSIQVKLLRVLQEREVRPVGATSSFPIDARIVTATNRDLTAMVVDGTFRQDLYYRLNVVQLEVPPLRARKEDVLQLARWFVARTSKTYGNAAPELSTEAAGALMAYPWPGNVRELENAIEHALAMAGGATKLLLEHLPATLREQNSSGELSVLFRQELSLEELERRYTLMVLARHQGSRVETARALKIGTNTLWRKLKRWGVAAEPR